MKRQYKKALAAVLAVSLAWNLMPDIPYAHAKQPSHYIVDDVEDLPDDIMYQQVEFGTRKKDLELPNKLEMLVRPEDEDNWDTESIETASSSNADREEEKAETATPSSAEKADEDQDRTATSSNAEDRDGGWRKVRVEWVLEESFSEAEEYDGEQPGIYVFEAQLANDRYSLGAGELPVIEVEVLEEGILADEELEAEDAGAKKQILSWQWADPEGNLTETEEGEFLLQLAASPENPVSFENIAASLPEAITAVTETLPEAEGTEAEEEPARETETILLSGWSCEAFGEARTEGTFVFEAELPEGYELAEDTDAVEIEVRLGEMITSPAIMEVYLPEEGSLPDNQELFAGYVERLFYGGISLYSGSYGERTLTGLDLQIYRLLKEKFAAVANGTEWSTEFCLTWEELGITQTTWTEEELEVTILENNQITDAARAAVMEKIGYNSYRCLRVLSCLTADCPYELYWKDKSHGMNYPGSLAARASVTDGVSSISLTGQGLDFLVWPAADYAGVDYYTVNREKTGAASKAVSAARQVVEEYAGESDLKKLEAYRDYICGAVSYNQEAADGSDTGENNPWQLIYVFDGNPDTNVVCEGYAKAFQYLCDLSSFTGAEPGRAAGDTAETICYTVTGTMTGGTGEGGAHMWNIVSLGGANYLADITNCDEGTIGAEGGLFLAGTGGSIDEGYTFTVNGQEISYTYDQDTVDLYGRGDDSILKLADTEYKEPVKKEDAAAGVTIDGITTYYLDLTEAFASVGADQEAVITLLDNVELEAGKNIAVSGTVVFEGGEYTLSGSYDGSEGLIDVSSGASLTMENGAIQNHVENAGSNGVRGIYTKNGTLTVKGGTITASGSSSSAPISGIYGWTGHIEIAGATISGTNASGSGMGIMVYGTAAITDGDISGKTYGGYFHTSNAERDISGGHFSGGLYGLMILPNTNMKLIGGVFTGGQRAIYCHSNTVGSLLETEFVYYKGDQAEGIPAQDVNTEDTTLPGGTYTVGTCTHQYGSWEYVDEEKHKGVCVYCGAEGTEPHTFGADGSCTAEGCRAQAKASVRTDGGDPVLYSSLEKAWAAAQGNTAVITLLADAKVSEVLPVTEGSKITLQSDPNHEYTITGSANESEGGLINITGGGSFTLVSGIITNGSDGANAIAVNDGSFVMNGGTVTALADGHSGICVYGGGTAEINGGSASGYNGLAIVDGGSGTVSGGTFTGTYSVANNSAAVLLRNVDGTLQTILKKGKAYYEVKDGAKTLITDLNGTRLYGTVTVEDCTHSCQSWTDDGETHTGTCVVCGEEIKRLHSWDENGTCTVCAARATASVTVGDGKPAYYPTIEDAWQAAKEHPEGATITLLSDVTVSSTLTVDGDDNIILTSETKTDGSETYSISGNSSSIISISGGSLTLKKGSVTGSEMYSFSGVQMIGGSFYMEDGNVSGYMALDIQNGEVYISGGSVKGGASSDGGYGINAIGGKIELTGGSYYGESAAITNMDSKLSGVAVSELLSEGYAFKQDGSWVSDITVSELKGTVTVEEAPIKSVSISPAMTTITYGSTAPTLTAAVTQPEGSANDVTYQWYLNGVKIAGATGETYTPDKLDVGKYTYTCTAAADGYSLSSTAATITVKRAGIEDVISVNVIWGKMEFTYTDGDWDPETHTYGEGRWEADNDGGNCVTVKNSGDGDVTVSYKYSPSVASVSGRLSGDDGNFIDGPVALPSLGERNAYLTLTGRPETSLNKATLGVITVTIGGVE